jgi:UbiD family decarboxylase
MATKDFRTFLAVSEQAGLLRRVSKKLDRTWAPACLAKWAFQALPDNERFGLMFENIEGSDFPLVIGALGASPATYALALDVHPDELNEKWAEALRNPISPKLVSEGPCQEVVRLGDDVKLSDLPIPVWTPGKDAAPYITTITVTRDANDGKQNCGVYRTMVKDDRHVVANINPGRQGYAQCLTYLDAGKPAPIAWVVGTEPVVHFATVANMPLGCEEITIAGGLKGAPVDMVKCKTSDILVPANSEFIIEGEVLPGEYADEGPFGEFAGYMSPVAKKPVVRITAITHRKDAIFYGYTSQMPPSESTVLQSLSNSSVLLKTLREDMGETSVQDIFIDLTFGGLLAHAIVSMNPRTLGHAKKIGRLIADMSSLKRITVVDADVDVRDPLHVEWAMNSHYNPARDTIIIDDVYHPMGMDPSVRVSNEMQDMGSKVVIDATQTIDAGKFSLPSKELMDKALDLWSEVGLPDFEIPKRAALRIANS